MKLTTILISGFILTFLLAVLVIHLNNRESREDRLNKACIEHKGVRNVIEHRLVVCLDGKVVEY